ncbi:amine oxidase [Mucilaginibacter terrae]|uniref:Beta-glucosidase/6-phospho-beta-glucosidase/beta-galactosidase n=1 Tax=Mucilaginibacter terrae TaxID=1955052 RepID=A0ABU3GZZ3_9SPHI|nr:amine oxidase [Mucilaginibacter terrae]MDT3405328.1 beta-glucosidase/6-phospho-beta-glucosidase/beta-galactosidase [Mucilaginibacter terrae]
MHTSDDSSPFQSFWMGGYECTDQLNTVGDRVDLINTTHHLSRLNSDYNDIKDFGITTVREGIRWSYVEKQPYHYDFSVVKTMLVQGKANGIQQIWDICHFGYPDDLSPLHPHFTKRFVGVCGAFVEFYRALYPTDTLIVTPINEVSFISWLGGEAAGTTPYCTGQGWTIKYALMRAYIAGIKAMKEIDPGIRILTTEPIVNIVPPLYATQAEIEEAARVHDEQYQALDILVGRICPELGGSPDMLDLMGVNFYYNNQWVVGFNEFLPWLNEEEDPRWRPLSKLLTEAYNRYNKPIVLTETSHPKEDRPLWIDFISKQCFKVLQQGVPFWGICLYPIIDRPDWDNLTHWHQSGLWDEVHLEDGTSVRILNEPYAKALRNSQRLIY